jgi:hypothetical protein
MEFVVVQTFSNYIEANIVMGNLEAHNIHCWLKDENTVTVMPIYDIAVGGIKLMVAEDHAEDAKKILQHFKEENKKYYHCPKCDSNNIEFITTNRSAANWLTIFFTWLLGSYAVGAKQVWHCFSCNAEFEEPKGNFPDMNVDEQ